MRESPSLSLGEQQQVEILRALLRNSRVLILDESTSMLTPKGIEELGALMRRLAEQGLAIIFITHKLKEAVAFGDRISVLKLGRKVGEITPEQLRSRRRSCDHRGHRRDDVRQTQRRSGNDRCRRTGSRRAQALHCLRSATSSCGRGRGNPGLNGVSFTIAAGEVLGIAGIDGNGQKQLAEALAGQLRRRPARSGSDGVELGGLSAGQRRAAGLRYLTDDRLGEGIVGAFPVAINFFLKEVGAPPLWRRGIERRGAIEARAAD